MTEQPVDGVNPQEPSQTDSQQAAPSDGPGRRAERNEILGFWRDGDVLIVERGAKFPDRCVVCCQPAEPKRLICRIRRSISQAWTIAFLCINGPLFLVIVSVCLPAVQIKPGLCAIHRGKETRGRLITGGLICLSVLIMFLPLVGFVLLGQDTPAWILLSGGFGLLLLFVAIAYGELRKKLLKARKIEKQFVWFEGAHWEFMDDFARDPND